MSENKLEKLFVVSIKIEKCYRETLSIYTDEIQAFKYSLEYPQHYVDIYIKANHDDNFTKSTTYIRNGLYFDLQPSK